MVATNIQAFKSLTSEWSDVNHDINHNKSEKVLKTCFDRFSFISWFVVQRSCSCQPVNWSKISKSVIRDFWVWMTGFIQIFLESRNTAYFDTKNVITSSRHFHTTYASVCSVLLLVHIMCDNILVLTAASQTAGQTGSRRTITCLYVVLY